MRVMGAGREAGRQPGSGADLRDKVRSERSVKEREEVKGLPGEGAGEGRGQGRFKA